LPEELEELAAGSRGPVTAELVRPLRAHAEVALESLREITRGVYPAQLRRTGLEPALRSLLARRDDATITVAGLADLPLQDARVEAAAYFCVAEAVRNLRGPVQVSLSRQEQTVSFLIDGQDAGDLPLDNMRDRAEAAGGSMSSSSRDGRVSLEVRLPVGVALSG
jgi:signal transduction histidine kinase